MTKQLLTPRRLAEIFGVTLDQVEAAIRKRPIMKPASRADSLPIFSANDVKEFQNRIAARETVR